MPDPFCPRCGAARPIGLPFCRGCGVAFGEVEPIADPSARTPSLLPPAARRPLLRSVIVLVIVMVGLAAISDPGGRVAAPSGTPLSGDTAGVTPGPAATGSMGSITRPTSGTTAGPTASTTPRARAFQPSGATQEASVVRVIDGDTIVVDIGGTQYRVRYIGMDTPELGQSGTPEPMAREATAANAALVSGKRVVLERELSETDQYGRLLRDVWVERGGTLLLVGLELVRTGYAQLLTYPPDVKYVDDLRVALQEARDDERGLWAPGATHEPPATRS